MGSEADTSLNAEERRLRTALTLTMERLNDMADIVRMERRSPLSESFLRASARRIERVLADENAQYHDDIWSTP